MAVSELDGKGREANNLVLYSRIVDGKQMMVILESPLGRATFRCLHYLGGKRATAHIRAVWIFSATPYRYHHVVEAMADRGMRQEALEPLKGGWGQMVQDGADTFLEACDPKESPFSPTGAPTSTAFVERGVALQHISFTRKHCRRRELLTP